MGDGIEGINQSSQTIERFKRVKIKMNVICLLCNLHELSSAHPPVRSSHMPPHVVQPGKPFPVCFRMFACLNRAVKSPSARNVVLVCGIDMTIEILRVSKTYAGTRWDGAFKRQSMSFGMCAVRYSC
jgi:hypothetical protein